MPFDFLKKKSSKDTAKATDAPKSSGKSDALRGKSFAQQSAALTPQPDHGMTDVPKAKSGGAMSSIKKALGLGGKKGVADPDKLELVSDAAQAAWGLGDMANNFVGKIRMAIDDAKAGGYADNHPEGIAKAERAIPLAKTVRSLGVKLTEAAKAYAKNGDLVKFASVLDAFLAAAEALHKAVLGHAGPGDFLTEDSFLLHSMSDKLAEGRTLSSTEKSAGVDPRKGPTSMPDPSASLSSAGFTPALRNYAMNYASNYAVFLDAALKVW